MTICAYLILKFLYTCQHIFFLGGYKVPSSTFVYFYGCFKPITDIIDKSHVRCEHFTLWNIV